MHRHVHEGAQAPSTEVWMLDLIPSQRMIDPLHPNEGICRSTAEEIFHEGSRSTLPIASQFRLSTFEGNFLDERDKSSERTITGAVLITSFLGSRNLVIDSPIVCYRLPAFEGTF